MELETCLGFTSHQKPRNNPTFSVQKRDRFEVSLLNICSTKSLVNGNIQVLRSCQNATKPGYMPILGT
jgi:hypothetical protein